MCKLHRVETQLILDRQADREINRGGRGWLHVKKPARGKNCSQTACRAPSKPQHTTKKEREKALAMLPCFLGPYAPAASFSSTMRTLPTKLAGDLTHTPINTPIEAICEILIIFYSFITFLHHSKFIAVSIIDVASCFCLQNHEVSAYGTCGRPHLHPY